MDFKDDMDLWYFSQLPSSLPEARAESMQSTPSMASIFRARGIPIQAS